MRKLLQKDEKKRIGARAGASEIKSHAFFKSINFALLRNMKPPIVPAKSNAIDAVYFRDVKESNSFDMDRSHHSSLPSPPTTDDDEEDPFADFDSGKYITSSDKILMDRKWSKITQTWFFFYSDHSSTFVVNTSFYL